MVSIPSEFTRYRVDFMRGFVAPRMIYCIVVLAVFQKKASTGFALAAFSTRNK